MQQHCQHHPIAERACTRAPSRAVVRCAAAAPTTPKQLLGSASALSILPWAIRAGIQWSPKVKPSDTLPGTGRGLVATADIAPGEALVFVPLSATLREWPGCRAVLGVPQQQFDSLPWPARLALLLLHEASLCSPESHWADYLALLPRHPVDLPGITWSDAEVAQLRAVYFIDDMQAQRREADELCTALAAYVDAVQLLWALSIVRSRAFAAPHAAAASPLGRLAGLFAKQQQQQSGEQEKQEQHVLTPLLDLFNHSSQAKSECEFVPDALKPGFRVVAQTPWQSKQEVLIQYGAASNDTLLKLYGFVEADNPSERYMVTSLPQLMTAALGADAAAAAALSEVAFTRDGIPAAAAARLAAAACPAGTAAAAHQAGAGAAAPYEALSAPVRALCAQAVELEISWLAVQPGEDETLLRMHEQLPVQQAAAAAKRAEVQQLQARSEQLAEMFDKAAAAAAVQHAQQQPGQHDGSCEEGNSNEAAGRELQGLLETCQQLQVQAEQELQALDAQVTAWQQALAGVKVVAVRWRLEKHKLLTSIQQRLGK